LAVFTVEKDKHEEIIAMERFGTGRRFQNSRVDFGFCRRSNGI